MADFKIAIALTLKNEGGFAWVKETNEVVNHGVTLDTLRHLGVLKTVGLPTPEDVAFVKSLTQDEAIEIYEKAYWGRMGELKSQELANKVFDVQVNTYHGIRFLQLALKLKDDGILGPKTLAAANAADPAWLIAEIKLQGKQYYEFLATKSAAWLKDLPTWLARLNA